MPWKEDETITIGDSKMKILCLVEDYPSCTNQYPMAFVHARNLVYVENSIDVEVLSFSSKKAYIYEEIKVITEQEAEKHMEKYDIIISHAVNLKNHVRFLLKNIFDVKKIMFFFHGHEIMAINKEYPKPFEFMKPNFYNYIFRSVYDKFKLKALKYIFFYLSRYKTVKFIFVSNWMQNIFEKNIGLKNIDKYVINNNINYHFANKKYNVKEKKDADFITIRPLDQSKYCIDLVVKLAQKYPQFKFDVYGSGMYFNHNYKPENIKLESKYFSSKELTLLLSKYKCALMPTRLDAQGVMVCEMASFGIPIITSDIEICREMLYEFPNIGFLNNNCVEQFDLELFFNSIIFDNKYVENNKFSLENTVNREIQLIQKFSIS